MGHQSPIIHLITFEAVLLGLLSLYGITSGGIDISATIQVIVGPWPTVWVTNTGFFGLGAVNCSFSASGPSGNCSMIDTGVLALIWGVSSLGSIFVRIGAAGYLVFQLISVLNVVTGIPFIGYVFTAFQVIMGLYAYSIHCNPNF